MFPTLHLNSAVDATCIWAYSVLKSCTAIFSVALFDPICKTITKVQSRVETWLLGVKVSVSVLVC